tara:strand:+ start:465 stop:950 length:486 start_codon:yes stop_codon:yes gene_type:complete
MGLIEDRIKDLGYILPDSVAPVANYVSTVKVEGQTGSNSGLVFTSGHVPRNEDGSFIVGKLGNDLTAEQGYDAAQNVALGILSSLKAELGDLDKISRIIKVLCMINATDDFKDHPAVANGASDLLVKVFAEKGKHARSAVGMSSLPANVPVEVELIVEYSI